MRKLLLALAMVVAVAVGRSSASPITTPGVYILSGALVGTVTSDGTKLTAWSFATVDPVIALWTHTDMLQVELDNSTSKFTAVWAFLNHVVRIDWDLGTALAVSGSFPCSPPGTVGGFFPPCPATGSSFAATPVQPPPPDPSVPEPLVMSLLAMGAGGLGLFRRRTA